MNRPRRRSPLLEKAATFLLEVRPEAPEPEARYVREMIATAVGLLDDETSIADLKLLNASLRELRHAFRVFARHSRHPKVTTFGSARMTEDHPEYQTARRFAERIVESGFDVITGAGGGIMRACQEGAGRDRSFGVNIRLPFEQKPNEFIAGDRKLMSFRYFFTRKLLFVKEAQAIVFFPGGFGTHDEAYETLTLVQTGKSLMVPLVFVDCPGGTFWRNWKTMVVDDLVARELISIEDTRLFRITDDVETAVREVVDFYRAYHSLRYVGDRLVLRLRREPPAEIAEQLEMRFHDISLDGRFELRGALPAEEGDPTEALPRIVFRFNRVSNGRLRELIDFLNGLFLGEA